MSGKKKNKAQNVHFILEKAGYNSPNYCYDEICKKAASLQNSGCTDEEILSEIVVQFGLPHKKNFMRNSPVPIEYFGEFGIDFEHEVLDQIETAARLPVAVRAAVMPDGHPGYALPIGGVIGLENAVSPSFVGYDIACRMTLTVLDIPPEELQKKRSLIANDMQAVSSFGLGAGFSGKDRRQHAVIEEPLWKQIPLLKSYHSLAHQQLGSSGGGNHFFDALVGEVIAEADWMPLPVGATFVALMTHSGSRGTGNKLAHHYQKLATAETRVIASGVPSGYEWLSLDSQAGQEYWQVMQLMGRYAQANHHLIHDLFLRRSGLQQFTRWENHHNFAFQEGDIVVHRKGATPAEKGRVGIIPGSSGTSSYIVEGLGNEASLNSSSHGAGRPRSRTASKRMHNEREYRNHMKYHDILSIGVEPDETFMAYKDIERVIAQQEGLLVRTIARMKPAIVIMGGHSDDGD